MSPQPRIIVVGDIVTDVLAILTDPLAPGSDTPAAVRLAGGGQAANTAAWLAWQGTPVTLVGTVGDDDAGRARLAELSGCGVRCVVRPCPELPTGTVIVLVRDGERTMVTERGANLRLAPGDVDLALAGTTDARHLHLSGYPLLDAESRAAGLRALAAARDHGLTTSVDAGSAEPLRRVGPAAFQDWVRGADLLLANAEEAAVLAEHPDPREAARRLATITRHAVVKRGAQGAVWAQDSGEIFEATARRVPVQDVTGAGDAFAAGLLAAWAAGADPVEALDRAGALAAVAIGTVGGRPPC